MNPKKFRFSLASLIIAVVISAVLFAFGPVAIILLGTPCLLIFGTVRAVRIPGRVRLFWFGFLLVGLPLFFAGWLPAPAPYMSHRAVDCFSAQIVKFGNLVAAQPR